MAIKKHKLVEILEPFNREGFVYLKSENIRISYQYNKSLRTILLLGHDSLSCRCCGIEPSHFESTVNSNSNSKVRKIALKYTNGSYATVDHIIPRKHGGQDIMTNYQILCNTCNFSKAGNMPAMPYVQKIRNWIRSRKYKFWKWLYSISQEKLATMNRCKG